MKLKHVTRGDSTPNGKQKVYISYHENDKVFIDEIAAKVLSISNVAVWYDETLKYGENLDYLNDFNLFIFIVSGSWTLEKNRSLDREFQLAKEKNIPILPIIVDDAVQDDFNHLTNNMHCIKKSDPEYDEKFKKQLQKLIIEDSQVEIIRRLAFLGKIFISYRKKDKDLARKLMRDIRQIKCCEYNAIWYDDFLLAGGKWDDKIEDTIKNCDIFIIVVTKNITEPGNYVLEKEYPLAWKYNKKILPIEVEPTDRQLVQDTFNKNFSEDKKLPEIVKAGSNEMAKKLAESWKFPLHKCADHIHMYYLGLAFLHGIDIEFDIEHAVNMLVQAATEGSRLAPEKLAEIYTDGIGVDADYIKAVEWFKHSIKTFKSAYKNNPDSDSDAHFYFWCQLDLGDLYYNKLNEISLAENLYNSACKFAELYCKNHSDEMLGDLLSGYERLIGIKLVQGDLTKAESLSEQCSKMAKKLSVEDRSQSLQSLARIYMRQSEIKKTNGDLNGAQQFIQKALNLREDLATSEPTIPNRNSLLLSCNALAEIKEANGDFKGAEELFRKCITTAEQLNAEAQTTDSIQNLSAAYAQFVRFKLPFSQDAKSMEVEAFCEKALKLSKKLADEYPNIIIYKSNLSKGYELFALLKKNAGDLNSADKFFRLALNIEADLVKKYPTISYKRDLAFAYQNLARNNNAAYQDNTTDTEQLLLNSAKLRREILAQLPSSIEDQINLAGCYTELGIFKFINNDFENADLFYKKSREIYEKIPRKSLTSTHKSYIATLFNNWGFLKCSEEKVFEAESLFSNALQISKEIVQVIPKHQNATYNLMISCYAIGVLKEDREYLLRSKQLCDDFLKTSDNPFLNEMCKTYSDRANKKLSALTPKFRFSSILTGILSLLICIFGNSFDNCTKSLLSYFINIDLFVLSALLGGLFGIISICLGIRAQKRNEKGGFAIALGLIGLVLSAIMLSA